MQMADVLFRDLAIGDTFDFRNPMGARAGATFSARCTKVGPRSYTWVNSGPAAVKAPQGYRVVRGATLKTRIGSINCPVYHVNEEA
jgi:hypothetical protein